jgi:hypothetical protein
VFDGRLTLRQVGALNQQASDALMARLADNLTALVEHCCAVKAPRHTRERLPGAWPLAKRARSGAERARGGDPAAHDLASAEHVPSQGAGARDHAYHLQTEIAYHQPLDVAVYRQAWQGQIARWPALRSELVLADGVALQRILKHAELPFHYEDLSEVEHAEARVQAYREQDLARPIPLEQAPLLRLACFKLAPITTR